LIVSIDPRQDFFKQVSSIVVGSHAMAQEDKRNAFVADHGEMVSQGAVKCHVYLF
jgi:hypothetical protein